ncbi:MAG: NACHT domain-containing protein, partial [bacterium]
MSKRKKIENDTTVYMAFVSIDLVGSRQLQKNLSAADYEKRYNFFINNADRIFKSFGASTETKKGTPDWKGEGRTFYFIENEAKDIEERSVRASIELLTILKVGIKKEIPIRISINSGIVMFKERLGTINDIKISVTESLNSAAPEDSILIAENVYDALPKELKEQFILCGTVRKDEQIAFIYPREKKHKIDAKFYLHPKDDIAENRRKYLETMEPFCKTLANIGIRQMRKVASLELTEAFFPLKLRKREIHRFEYERTLFPEEFAEMTRDKTRGSKELKGFIPEHLRGYAVDSTPSPFKEIFEKTKHLIILGDPGSGKTTLLKWLCLLYSRGERAVWEEKLGTEKLFPILVPIAGIYHKEPMNAVDAIAKYFEGFHLEKLDSVVRNELKSGNCIVLLDGLDEIPDPKDRFTCARYIEGFVRAFPNNRFIITSRIIGYEEIHMPETEVYTLCELEDEDIKTFTKKWFVAFEKSLTGGSDSITTTGAENIADDLIKAILGNEPPGIHELAKNPFLLSLIATVQRQGQILPRSRVKLYDLCTETLFETWHSVRSVFQRDRQTNPTPYEDGVKVLAPLALWMHESLPGGIAPKDQIKEKLTDIMTERRGMPYYEALKVSGEFFIQLADQSQLIIDRGADRWG